MRRIWILVLMVVTALGTKTSAQIEESHVRAKLLANTTALAPGTTASLGVLFEIDPGWHIYWSNPGETGFATTVKWDLPAGLEASEVAYPTPWFFESPGPLASFGYEHRAMLVGTVHVPKNLIATEVQLKANVRWLMCSDRCIPGKSEVALRLPVGPGKPANETEFAEAAGQLPAETVSLSTETSITKVDNCFIAGLRVKPQPKALVTNDKFPDSRKTYFFPEKMTDYVTGVPVVNTDKSGVYVQVKLTPSKKGLSPPASVSGVLVFQFEGEKPQAGRLVIK